jgi:hypothetical protein
MTPFTHAPTDLNLAGRLKGGFISLPRDLARMTGKNPLQFMEIFRPFVSPFFPERMVWIVGVIVFDCDCDESIVSIWSSKSR